MEPVYSPQFEYPTEQPSGPTFKEHLVDFIQSIVVIGAIFALIYWQVAQPHKVSGNSMIPTFKNNDYILTDKVTYRFSSPKHGDIIVLKNPRDESQDFIKRIIALPGDTITVQGGLVYINNQLLSEKYLSLNFSTPNGNFLRDGEEIKAGQNQFFVFGDNRNASSDSREWGPVTREEIVGRVVLRYWPLGSFGLITNP